MPVYLVSYAKCMLYSEQPTVLLAKNHLITMIWTNFENLSFISNIFQETHDFLSLTDLVIIYIYLRTTDRHFRDQGKVCHPTSKLLICDLVQTLNALRNSSFEIFAARTASLVIFIFIYLLSFLIGSNRPPYSTSRLIHIYTDLHLKGAGLFKSIWSSSQHQILKR